MVRVVCLFLKGVDTPLLFLSPFAGPSPISRCNLHATSRSSHSRRSPSCRFLLYRVALVCLVLRRRRRLPLPCSRGFLRLSAQLCPPGGIFWPLEFIELSSRTRTTLLTPTAIICRQVISLLRSTLSSNTCTSRAQCKRKKTETKGGMGGRHAATTQGF